MSYDVVLKGFRLNLEETPAKVLERVLGLNPTKARKATQRFPVLLARTSKEKAERVAAALGDAGAIVEISEAAPDAPELDTGRSQVGLAPVAPSLAGAGSALAHAPTLIQRPSAEPAAMASALPYAAPDNDFELETNAASYQLGELALDLGAPKAAPVAAAAPRPEPAADLGGIELDMEAAPPSRRKAAPAPAEAPGTDGMQSFGDGFDDDVNADAPALELDAGPDFRKQNVVKVSSRPAPPVRRGSGPGPAPRYAPPIQRSRKYGFADRVIDALTAARNVALHGVALAVVTGITLLAIGYARSPDALFEAVGLGAPPAAASETNIRYVRPGAVPTLRSTPRIHPLLRLAPEQLTVELAHRLRDDIPGVERVPVTWPEAAGLRARDVECVLVEQPANDPKRSAYHARMHALLRTGHPLEIPPEVAPDVRARLVVREREGRAAGFGELCLAL